MVNENVLFRSRSFAWSVCKTAGMIVTCKSKQHCSRALLCSRSESGGFVYTKYLAGTSLCLSPGWDIFIFIAWLGHLYVYYLAGTSLSLSPVWDIFIFITYERRKEQDRARTIRYYSLSLAPLPSVNYVRASEFWAGARHMDLLAWPCWLRNVGAVVWGFVHGASSVRFVCSGNVH